MLTKRRNPFAVGTAYVDMTYNLIGLDWQSVRITGGQSDGSKFIDALKKKFWGRHFRDMPFLRSVDVVSPEAYPIEYYANFHPTVVGCPLLKEIDIVCNTVNAFYRSCISTEHLSVLVYTGLVKWKLIARARILARCLYSTDQHIPTVIWDLIASFGVNDL